MCKIKCAVLLLIMGHVLAEESIGRRRAIPVLYVRGSHYEVGFDVGRNFASIIRSFLSSYGNLRDFEREYKTEAGRAVFDQTLANMKKRFPYYLKEMQGIADGAKVPFYQLFLLQLDDIMLTASEAREPRNDTGGCSSVGLNNRQYTVLGHTEDAFSETVNHFYIVQAHIIPTPEDAAQGATEERFASLCYAGQLPGYTMGFNEHGLVFSINTLSPHQLKPGSTPRTFVTRKVLSARSFADAERILRDEGLGVANGFSINMIWSDAWSRARMSNAEVAPDLGRAASQLDVRAFDHEPLVHCNMYERLPVDNVIGNIIDSSEWRLKRLRSQPAPQSARDVAALLSDTSGTEFRVFQDQPGAVITTIAAGIFDVVKRTWSLYINRPNASEPVAVLPIRFDSLQRLD